MFKRFMLISALVISAVAVSGTRANAQFFDGWGWFGFSSARGLIDLAKVKNPDSQPTIVIAKGTSSLAQIACLNPGTQGISGGNAFTTELNDFDSVNPKNVTAKGNTTITILFVLDGLEVNTNCQNPNWLPIEDSAMLLAFSAHLDWFKCTNEDLNHDGDPDPCVDIDPNTGQTVFTIDQSPKGLIQSADLSCTLDTTLYPRNANGTAPSNAVFDCTPPPPHK